MRKIKAIQVIGKEYSEIRYSLDERRVRVWCAAKARAYDRENGRGGVMIVHQSTGVSRRRIYAGLEEIQSTSRLNKERVRNFGGGRKKIIDKQPKILEALENLVEPYTRGDPETPLRWTSKSTYKLAEELVAQGYSVSHTKVSKLLAELNYSLQSNRKSNEGKQHVDRNAQFEWINEQVKNFHRKNQPAISVDTKKKENIGNYKNPGREYSRKGNPTKVETYDFPSKDLGKAIPYGVYDLKENKGWVSVGINHDTAEFAVNAIHRWYKEMGRNIYPKIKSLLITADGGGSNGHRVRLWKRELQKLSNELAIDITVCHYPPGTSKWNKIEHRMFSFITKNWRGKPLIDRQTVVELIGNTTTKSGLKIKAVLDESVYQKGIKITDEEMQSLNIERLDFHGEWNYKIKPTKN